MNYKETLFFTAQCLTINHEVNNLEKISKQIISKTVDWDKVVQLSTAHYVFPALYCNLKKANLLQYLPTDLVAYMKEITGLNRERNLQIIEQAKEINSLLLANDITPVFLKGTGNLVEGLYEDVAERMVGDIDFIIDKKDYKKTIDLLFKDGYDYVDKSNYHLPLFKHYPRIIKENYIAALEIHKELIAKKYANEFNFTYISEGLQVINNFTVLSYKKQLSLSIIAKKIHDFGEVFKDISLRNAYDVFLLSKNTNAQLAFDDLQKIKKPLNNFLASCYEVFGQISSLKYTKSIETKRYLFTFYKYLHNQKLYKLHYKLTKFMIFLYTRTEVILKSFFNKETRKWLFKRVTDKEWIKEKLIQLRLRKNNKFKTIE